MKSQGDALEAAYEAAAVAAGRFWNRAARRRALHAGRRSLAKAGFGRDHDFHKRFVREIVGGR